MNLADIRVAVTKVEPLLAGEAFVIMMSFQRDGRTIHVGVTERLWKSCRRGRVWKSRAFLTALKNAQYGYDVAHAQSAGGADGIFLLTREHRPKNHMMRKLFERFLDRPGSGAAEVAEALGTPLGALVPVRLVSHHMRLLGVLDRQEHSDTLVLVDYDDTK